MAVFPLHETWCALPTTGIWLMVWSRGPQVGGISTASLDYQLIWEVPFHHLQSICIVLQGHSALSNEKVQIFLIQTPIWISLSSQCPRDWKEKENRKSTLFLLLHGICLLIQSPAFRLLWSMDYPLWEDGRRRRRGKRLLTCRSLISQSWSLGLET